ncbi:MAG: HEPN domain-containing protein [archaeon]
MQGHLEKADHNLKFVKSTLELKEFNDWAIVSAYYSIYHASLALCALKGYSTRDHNATLLILINEFYGKGLQKEEIEIVNNSTLEKEEVLYYIEAKSSRNKASYSTQKAFGQGEAKVLRKKAISFVNKAKEIIDSNNVL